MGSAGPVMLHCTAFCTEARVTPTISYHSFLSLSSPPLLPPPLSPTHEASSRTQPINRLCSRLFCFNYPRHRCCQRRLSKGVAVSRRSKLSEDSDYLNNESRFLDDKGVIKDMDGYLNHLSLEYESVWDTKPSWFSVIRVLWFQIYPSRITEWCQPWTITLTGVLVITFSWLILHSVVVTAIASSLIGVWWYTFLYSYPKAYTEMIEERRKRVTNGTEDTYGYERSQ